MDDDPEGNVQHIAQHGLTKEDVRCALENPIREDVSRSSGRPLVYGYTPDDILIVVLFERIDEQTVYPVTAYEIEG